jgi:hypothetical protein
MPTTRIVSAGIIPVLVAAFVILYLFPGHTKQLWAWTISPTMSVMLMGGGYISGAYFFARAATVRQWHRVGWGFPGTTVFTTFLLLATIVHWDRFNHGHVSFWAWLLLYVTTPFLLPWLWIRNRRFDPVVPEPGERLVPRPIRTIMTVVGAGQLAFAVLMFVRPTLVIPHWPWALTPLTARSLAGFASFPAVAYLCFAFDRRWSSFQLPIETAMLGMAFIGVAAIRAHEQFHGSAFLVWGWRVGLVVAFVLLATLRLAMARPVAKQAAARA